MKPRARRREVSSGPAAFVLAVWLLASAGCQHPPLEPVHSDLEEADGNFRLYVSNQSFAIDPVDIRVWIDDIPVICQYFKVGNQHNWQLFRFALDDGEHRIKAATEKGDATLEQTFTVEGDRWAVLDYWYYPGVDGGADPTPPHFSFSVHDEQVYFM